MTGLFWMAAWAAAVVQPMGQDNAFIEPEYYTVSSGSSCPANGLISAEFKSTRGRVEVVDIAGLGHKLTIEERGRLNELLRAYVGLKSVHVDCEPGSDAFIGLEALPRDDSKGAREMMVLDWRRDGFTVLSRTPISK